MLMRDFFCGMSGHHFTYWRRSLTAPGLRASGLRRRRRSQAAKRFILPLYRPFVAHVAAAIKPRRATTLPLAPRHSVIIGDIHYLEARMTSASACAPFFRPAPQNARRRRQPLFPQRLCLGTAGHFGIRRSRDIERAAARDILRCRRAATVMLADISRYRSRALVYISFSPYIAGHYLFSLLLCQDFFPDELIRASLKKKKNGIYTHDENTLFKRRELLEGRLLVVILKAPHAMDEKNGDGNIYG